MIVTRKNIKCKAITSLLLLTLDVSNAFSPTISSPYTRNIPQNGSINKLFRKNHAHDSIKLYSQTEEENGVEQPITERTVSKEIMDNASDALTSVGWSAPMLEEELTSDDPFVKRINAQIQEESGVNLDELLNPAKVVNLERDLINLRSELAVLTGKGNDLNIIDLTTEECDGGGGGEEVDKIRAKINKKENDLLIERRSVFRGWLKNVFLAQAGLSLGLSWIMATDPSILFGGFDWYNNVRSIDVSIQVLGFWWWWLFIVPSLRSRRPTGFEKKALDIAFIGTPAVSLIAPVATKDTAIIWIANFVLVAGAYGFSYLTFDENDSGDDSKKQPAWLKFVMKSLDFGSGKERGARN
mmetsp:Transcript_5243/g.6744  ORF Transcript_5243/g.6744 Transcript_5243/m.6744 type:complete len:355 (+) Transcript_5243:262-1326(+)